MATRGETALELVNTSHTVSVLGTVVTRVLVPLWLLAGAGLALVDRSPSHLPVALREWLEPTGLNLGFVLRFSAAVELTVIAVILLLPWIARPVALALLVLFLPVLVGDLAMGAASCGCFGAVEVPPWLTLIVDVALLLGVWLLGGRTRSLQWRAELPTGRVLGAAVLALGAFALSFGLPAPNAAEGRAEALPADGYYVPDYSSWLGRQWSTVEITKWIDGMPAAVTEGDQYVLFYRKDCTHCHELLETYFALELPLPTTVVAVPERNGFPTEGVLSMPCTECQQAELPAGVDWFMQTPVLVRLAGGVVQCAAEVDVADPECLVW